LNYFIVLVIFKSSPDNSVNTVTKL